MNNPTPTTAATTPTVPTTDATAAAPKKRVRGPDKRPRRPRRTRAEIEQDRAQALALAALVEEATATTTAPHDDGDATGAQPPPPDVYRGKSRNAAEMAALKEIDVHERQMARNFLIEYQHSRFIQACRAVGISGYMPFEWRDQSEPFRTVFDTIRKRKEGQAVAQIEQTMTDRATEAGDVRAAALILPAFDARYRAGGQQSAQAVQINITL